MYQGNLSFEILEKYLRMLVGCGMLEAREDAKFYIATEKGLQLLSDYQELIEHSEIAENKRRALEESLTERLPAQAS
jgi:predicted transcriptional regulator